MEDEEESSEEDVARAYDGRMLVLFQALSTQKSKKDEQRENIFHSRCTFQGKVCSLIINGGSCANIVSLSMIEMLNLQTPTLPHPYNIQWLS